MTPITDFFDLRKIVNAGTVILQVVSTEESGWTENNSSVTTHIGAVSAVEINQRGDAYPSATIWMKDRPEPIRVTTPARNEPAIALSFRMIADSPF